MTSVPDSVSPEAEANRAFMPCLLHHFIPWRRNMSSLQQGLIQPKPPHYAASARGSRKADLWHYLGVKHKGSTWLSAVHNCWLSHNTAGKRSLWSRYCQGGWGWGQSGGTEGRGYRGEMFWWLGNRDGTGKGRGRKGTEEDGGDAWGSGGIAVEEGVKGAWEGVLSVVALSP